MFGRSLGLCVVALLAVTAVSTPARAAAAAPGDRFDQLTLSPVDSGRAPVAAESFGAAVATGDFNKDGYSDIAVGAPKDRTGANRDAASGTVTVFAGGANGPATGKVLLQTAFGAADEAGDLFGSALVTGDFNQDGYADLAIGAPGEQVGTIRAGAIATFAGSSTGLAKATGYDQNDLGLTDVAGDEFGQALAAGDFNGDGFTDLSVGAPGKTVGSSKSGQVVVLKGSSSGLLKTSPWIVDQRATAGANETGDLFGAALAAGNVLGARYADLVVGVPGEAPGSEPQSGLVYVIPGSAAGPVSGGVALTQSGNGGSNELGDRFGAALATGDFDKDGWSDVVAGIPGESPRTDPQSGALAIFPGGETAAGPGYPLEERDFAGGSNLAGDLVGSVFAVGDVNKDGYEDLLAGAPGRSSGAGVVHTFLGGGAGKSLTPGFTITQPEVYETDEPGDGFGTALAAGDLNKDGKADAVIGNPGEAAPGEPAAGTVVTASGLTTAAANPPAVVAKAACATMPAVVAHRGGTEKSLENTLGAFRSAGEAGISTWELDVRFDINGTPVILHDDTVDRVSPRTGSITKLDASNHGIATDDGQYIPTLREVYELAQTYHAQVLTELKVMPTETQWAAVTADVDETIGRSSVALMSFEKAVVRQAKARFAGTETGVLQTAGYLSPDQIHEYGTSLMQYAGSVSASRASSWHAGGVKLYAWTVDSQADWAKLSAWPVDLLITNKPIAYDQWAAQQCAAAR